MRVIDKGALALAAGALAGGQAVAQTPPPCVTVDEVKAITLVLLPDALAQVGKTCATALPETALLRRTDAPLFARYRAQVAPNRALAAAGFAKIAGADAGTLLDSDAGVQLMSGFIGPMLAQEIKQEDCGAVNRVVELLEPLPPENLAGLFATILQLSERGGKSRAKDGSKEKDSPLPVCPLPG